MSDLPNELVVRSSRGIPENQRIEDMLADVPWTTWHKISWSPQNILPAGMNVLLANAECRNPPPAPASTFKTYTFFPSTNKNPPKLIKPTKGHRATSRFVDEPFLCKNSCSDAYNSRFHRWGNIDYHNWSSGWSTFWLAEWFCFLNKE